MLKTHQSDPNELTRQLALVLQNFTLCQWPMVFPLSGERLCVVLTKKAELLSFKLA